MDILKVYHQDHGVSSETITWALSKIRPDGFFIRTLVLLPSHPDLENGLYGPLSGDEPVSEEEVSYLQRSPDRPLSRMVARSKRPTRLLTIIGIAAPEGATIFTAYGGPAAEREVGDPSLTPGTPDHDRSVSFWAEHALASL